MCCRKIFSWVTCFSTLFFVHHIIRLIFLNIVRQRNIEHIYVCVFYSCDLLRVRCEPMEKIDRAGDMGTDKQNRDGS